MIKKQESSLGFTKKHTQIAKGAAILFMVYHHLFVLPERMGNNYISVINLFGYDLQSILANFSKICVCIFVFCSGIGLYYSLINIQSLRQMYKKVLIHGLKFLTNFWIILIFLFPIGLYLHYFSFNTESVVYLALASYREIMEWWFVKLYLLLLLVSPIIVRLFQNIDVVKKIIPLAVAFSILILYHLTSHFIGNKGEFINNILISFSHIEIFDCVMTFIVGMICANFNVIDYYQKKTGYRRWLLCSFSAFAAIFIRVLCSNTPTGMNVDFVVVPMFILPLTTVCYNTKVGTILQFFGKHSTNIWLTHTFWCYYFGQKIVLIPKYSIFIYFWLLFLSLFSSYIINLLYIPVCNLIFSKSHKFSYKGYFFISKKTSS